MLFLVFKMFTSNEVIVELNDVWHSQDSVKATLLHHQHVALVEIRRKCCLSQHYLHSLVPYLA